MRVRGYGVRPSNNGYSVHKNSGDEFNRDYKQVRYVRAEEYATRDVQEYHHYPDQKDLMQDDDDKQLDDAQEQSRKQKNSSKSRLQALQQVVVALVGAAVIATSYQVAMAKKAAQQTDDPGNSAGQDADKTGKDTDAASVFWEWSDDFTKAVMILKDSKGNEIARVDAQVISTEEPAKCTLTGKITYTDTCEKETPALGHTFDEGTETTTDSGEPATDFTCERCGEHFIIQNSLNSRICHKRGRIV